MLNIIGIGLRGFRSLTMEELGAIRSSDRLFLDGYTSVITPGLSEEIRKNIGREVETVGRRFLESDPDLYDLSSKINVSLLVSGDPFMATTHNEIRYQCLKRGISVLIFENASILNTSVGLAGLSPYKVSPPVSLPRVTEKFFPLSVYRKIAANMHEKKHTLLLLDTADGNPMTVSEALQILSEMERREKGGIILENSLICIASALGSDDPHIFFGTFSMAKRKLDFRVPSTIIILGDLDPNEEEYVNAFCEPL